VYKEYVQNRAPGGGTQPFTPRFPPLEPGDFILYVKRSWWNYDLYNENGPKGTCDPLKTEERKAPGAGHLPSSHRRARGPSTDLW
jgi:hypothetical protein